MASRIIGEININDDNLKHDVSYLNSVTKLPEEYDEFGQGHWKNISIYNASGNASDSQYRQTDECLSTEHAARCPSIQALVLQHFKFKNLKMIRARSLVDGMVIPHRDFVELDKATPCFRVNTIIKKAQALRRYLIEKRDMGERHTINNWTV